MGSLFDSHMSVQSSVFAEEWPFFFFSSFFYKPLFMGSERPPLANNWRLDCSVSIWRVSRDRLGPAVLWKGQSTADLAGDGRMTGNGKHVGERERPER